MRTSLTKLREAVFYLNGELPPEGNLVYQSRLLTDPLFKLQHNLLQKTFFLLKIYHRKQLKREAGAILQSLMNDPQKKTFRAQVRQLFEA